MQQKPTQTVNATPCISVNLTKQHSRRTKSTLHSNAVKAREGGRGGGEADWHSTTTSPLPFLHTSLPSPSLRMRCVFHLRQLCGATPSGTCRAVRRNCLQVAWAQTSDWSHGEDRHPSKVCGKQTEPIVDGWRFIYMNSSTHPPALVFVASKVSWCPRWVFEDIHPLWSTAH